MKKTQCGCYLAALERLALARQLESKAEHFAAHYFAGIAVECIRRALSVNPGEPFDGTHSLARWAEKANLLPRSGAEAKNELRAKINELDARWSATQRYHTENELKTHLHRTALYRRARGSAGSQIKLSSGRMLEMANDVVSLAVTRWETLRTNSRKRS